MLNVHVRVRSWLYRLSSLVYLSGTALSPQLIELCFHGKALCYFFRLALEICDFGVRCNALVWASRACSDWKLLLQKLHGTRVAADFEVSCFNFSPLMGFFAWWWAGILGLAFLLGFPDVRVSPALLLLSLSFEFWTLEISSSPPLELPSSGSLEVPSSSFSSGETALLFTLYPLIRIVLRTIIRANITHSWIYYYFQHRFSYPGSIISSNPSFIFAIKVISICRAVRKLKLSLEVQIYCNSRKYARFKLSQPKFLSSILSKEENIHIFLKSFSNFSLWDMKQASFKANLLRYTRFDFNTSNASAFRKKGKFLDSRTAGESEDVWELKMEFSERWC